MNTELPPSIIIDDHGTIRNATFVRVAGGNTVYRIEDGPRLVSLRKALADCVECLKRLPDVEGAYRVSCLSQAQQALGMGYSGATAEGRTPAETERAMEGLIEEAFGIRLKFGECGCPGVCQPTDGNPADPDSQAEPPATRLESDTNRAMDLIGKALGL